MAKVVNLKERKAQNTKNVHPLPKLQIRHDGQHVRFWAPVSSIDANQASDTTHVCMVAELDQSEAAFSMLAAAHGIFIKNGNPDAVAYSEQALSLLMFTYTQIDAQRNKADQLNVKDEE